MREYRCKNCGKLLFRADEKEAKGKIEVKCTKCKEINKINISKYRTIVNYGNTELMRANGNVSITKEKS